MYILKLNLYLLVLMLEMYNIIEVEGTLEMVHLLYRHGDRSPIDSYPTDPYKNHTKYWPEGFGQLTKEGKQMEYRLGAWLRYRYNDFISENFNVEEEHVISTDSDRTLMSAQCVLASLFYPNSDSRFNDSVAWMPTPVHTTSRLSDKLLHVDDTCPRVDSETAKVKELPDVKQFWRDNKLLADYLSEHSGSKIHSIMSMAQLYDTLKIEANYNLTLPSWTNGHLEEMKKVHDFSFGMLGYTRELKRLKGGPLLKEMYDHMSAKDRGHSTKKMYMYSAHDSTVSVLLLSMGVFNDLAPPYAATVLVELHNINGERYVKTFYQNDSTLNESPHALVVPQCAEVCPLHEWKKLMEDIIPNDWEKECHIVEIHYLEVFSGFSVILGLVLLLSLIIYLVKTMCCCLCAGKKEYKPLKSVDVKSSYGSFKKNNVLDAQWVA